MTTEQTLLSKLKLISKFKALLFDEVNKNQILKEAYSKGNMILLNEFTKNVQITQTNFEPSMVGNCPQTIENFNPHLVKQRDFSQKAVSQTQFKQGDFEKLNPPPEAIGNHIEPNKKVQTVQNDALIPKMAIDVLILINNEDLVNYVKRTFEQPGIRFLYHLQDLKFENPTIIVRISASRNLDDRLETAIKNKRPSRPPYFYYNKFFLEKPVTMILLSKGSVPVSDKQIMVPNTQTRIDAYAFLYNDQYNEPPFRRENVCETKGIFEISDVFDLIRSNM